MKVTCLRGPEMKGLKNHCWERQTSIKQSFCTMFSSISQKNIYIWLAIRKKGLSDICVKCHLGLACPIRAG